jgi:sugar phosphate isomerase/epimerase
MLFAVQAARNLGLRGVATLSGGFLAPFQGSGLAWPEGLAETAFTELCRRWRPVLEAAAEAEVDLCFEPRPGQDVQDGVTFERFLAGVSGHPRCRLAFNPAQLLLQQIDYLDFLDTYRERIGLFHAGDAELEPGGRQALLSGYGPPRDRPARLRAPGDGQVDFASLCSRLAAHGYDGWAVVHWACAIKHPLAGARDAAELLAAAMVRTPPPEPPRPVDEPLNRRILGLP